MASKHSSMQMFICMPINKCAPRLKLQYTVQIQQSEWHSPCTSHQCLAPLQTENHASLNCSLTSKTLTKIGSGPRDRRRSEGGEEDGENLRKRDILIIVKLKIHNLGKYWGYICHGYISCPQFSPMNLQFLFFKHLFVNILQVTESYFLLFSSLPLFLPLPSLLCCLFLSEPDTSPW